MSESIKVISFCELYSWGYGLLINDNEYQFKYPMVKIGTLLTEYKEKAVLIDDAFYTRVTIKINNKGVVKRDIALGKEIKTKEQYFIKSGQFIFSHIDARNGAFGIVPKALDGAIVTNSFATFNCDEDKILPLYLNLLVCTDYFKKIWLDLSVGTTNRRSVSSEKFLNVKIPLPSLEQQEKIIAQYQNQVSQAQFMKSECDYSIIEKTLEEHLQLQFYDECKKSDILSLMNFSHCNTWDVRSRITDVFISSRFHQLPLSSIAKINPTLDHCVKDEMYVSFVPMECVSDLDGRVTQQRICKSSAKGFTKFENGDIIWAKITPCMQNGKSAVVYNLKNGIGYGSTEFYVIRVNNEFVMPEYIYYLLRTYRVRQAATNYFSGSAGQQRVRKSFLENLSIPLPSIEEQKEIVGILDAKKAEIISARSKAENLLTKAKQDFENAIFE